MNYKVNHASVSVDLTIQIQLVYAKNTRSRLMGDGKTAIASMIFNGWNAKIYLLQIQVMPPTWVQNRRFAGHTKNRTKSSMVNHPRQMSSIFLIKSSLQWIKILSLAPVQASSSDCGRHLAEVIFIHGHTGRLAHKVWFVTRGVVEDFVSWWYRWLLQLLYFLTFGSVSAQNIPIERKIKITERIEYSLATNELHIGLFSDILELSGWPRIGLRFSDALFCPWTTLDGSSHIFQMNEICEFAVNPLEGVSTSPPFESCWDFGRSSRSKPSLFKKF